MISAQASSFEMLGVSGAELIRASTLGRGHALGSPVTHGDGPEPGRCTELALRSQP